MLSYLTTYVKSVWQVSTQGTFGSTATPEGSISRPKIPIDEGIGASVGAVTFMTTVPIAITCAASIVKGANPGLSKRNS